MRILVTGGAGYVGSLLVPALLERSHDVVVWDTCWFGRTLTPHINLRVAELDIRRPNELLFRFDAVIHLACIANDPSFDLNPEVGKEINYDATIKIAKWSRDNGVKRFIYASSSSVYGVKPDGVEVTEDLPLEPLTDYSKYKAQAEAYILGAQSNDFHVTILRPATLCGYSPRQRLDLIVNILTTQAVMTGKIPIFGGGQYRPNLHVKDMVRAYLYVLNAQVEKVAGEVFNVVYSSDTVMDLARAVRDVVGGEFVTTPTADNRSYRVNGDKIQRVLGFETSHTIYEAIEELAEALRDGRLPNALTDPRYYNIKQMQTCHIS